MAEALFVKGDSLGAMGRADERLLVYDEVIRRFADRSEPSIAEYVAMALVDKAVALESLGRADEALLVYDDVIHRFADRSEPGIAEQVAKARLNKAAATNPGPMRADNWP